MTWIDFTIRLLIGFFLGVGIGIERQWLKTRAVLKTNVLVTLGSAMFVMLSVMTTGDTSPTRVSAQIVSGSLGRHSCLWSGPAGDQGTTDLHPATDCRRQKPVLPPYNDC